MTNLQTHDGVCHYIMTHPTGLRTVCRLWFYSSFNSKNMKINFEESPRVKCLVLPEIVVVELSEDNGILSGLMTL